MTWSLDDPHIGDVLISEADLRARVGELGAAITKDYAGRAPFLVGVLKGAFVFMGDLARAIELPVAVDFMAVSSYGSATRTSGVVRIIKDLDVELEGRDVIVVEDIVESGLTLRYLLTNLASRNPASLAVCALLRKPDDGRGDLPIAYVGFDIPPAFVIGYGLDVAERYRNLPFIATYREDV
ncbi:hypoxanthine phosphoribosyltransferase [Acidimicrobium ferrooxidans DSM 10331]|uniref:Hypoxanthine phosphoribosyltransferase n=1 Tax=Acidimicrobium ferrooxidans (strain DSM 10331 / JCM 15462 / NBRC 103882 / ICP) TaxID=525909 RepID=C7M1S1_ACIFD|nr:hypoxanthine phosphoribosyltransferase [Acidimicrobium ferrooxidans]ACU54818.1 hypoxanthine phosphoribosyltransferase [Acidimicrobium ferrooxidans DSM 10331]